MSGWPIVLLYRIIVLYPLSRSPVLYIADYSKSSIALIWTIQSTEARPTTCFLTRRDPRRLHYVFQTLHISSMSVSRMQHNIYFRYLPNLLYFKKIRALGYTMVTP